MDNYYLVGIQQIGVGAENLMASWKWYADMFQMNIRIFEEEAEVRHMLPYTDNKPEGRHACLAANLQGGGGFEICQYTERKPIPLDVDIQIGDLGIFCAKIKTNNIAEYHAELAAKYKSISQIYVEPNGLPTFYIRDPYGNLFQVVEDKHVFIDENRYSGGVVGVMIGVSDIDKALSLYRDILGYDTVEYDRTGMFSDWQTLRGGTQQYRRLLLSHSKPFQGPFSSMYGPSTIELVQALERKPRKIFEKPRQWGDPGFIHICYEVVNMRAFEEHCKQNGYPFTVDSCPAEGEPEKVFASGHLACIEDPDGTLIEFVEIHKIPIINYFNIDINLMKRDRSKVLPMFYFQLMRLNRVKFK